MSYLLRFKSFSFISAFVRSSSTLDVRMEYRVLSILILFSISATLIQSKTFVCKEQFYTSQCTITDVATEDSIILSGYTYSSSSLYYPVYNFSILNLVILNSTMDDIPSISSNKSIHFYYLNCVGCGLPNITKQSFSQFGSLMALTISYGSYEKLQKHLFSQVPSLANLDVSHGAIAEIDDNAFYNLTRLQMLDLSFNKITKITSNMFSSLSSLRSISLSYNQIKILDEGLFVNNTMLQSLHIDHNEIIEIEGALFNPEHIVSAVILSYNELTMLDTANVGAMNVWADNNKLEKLVISTSIQLLKVSENYIENVICDEKRSTIKVLDMNNNALTDLGCIGSLSQLTQLHLIENNIGKLNHSTFAALTELTMLFLQSANIGKLDYGIFSHQRKLEVLDISYNDLGNIALEMLLAAKGLKHLYIDGNKITEFSYSDLKSVFADLSIIGISDNDFNCTYLAQAIKQLNIDGIVTVVNEKNRVIDSHNINGIGCQVKNEMTTQSSTLHSSETSQIIYHSDYALIRNLNIILIVLIVTFFIYKGYKFVKNDVPRMRGYRNADSSQNHIEMDNSSVR